MYQSFVSNFHYELTSAGYIKLKMPVDILLPINIDIWARESGAVVYFYITYDKTTPTNMSFEGVKQFVDQNVKFVTGRVSARHAVAFHIFVGEMDDVAMKHIDETESFILAEQYDMYLGINNNLQLVHKPKIEINTDKCRDKVVGALRRMTDGVVVPTTAPHTKGFPGRISQNVVKFPIFSTGIIAINIFMFILLELAGGSSDPWNLLNFGAAQYRLAFHHGEWWRFITPMFLHIGFMHLLFNTMWIAIIGIRLEKFIGHYKFLAIYLVSGIVGNVAMMLLSHNAVGAGASGAIFGLFGSMFIYALVTKKQPGDLSVQSLAILIILQVGFGFVAPSMIDGAVTSNTAHIAGLIAGFVLGFIFALFSKKRIKND